MIFQFNKYDDFAVDYSNKRKKPWKHFVEFLRTFFNWDNPSIKKDLGVCCDMGCGSGRHTALLLEKSDVYIGLDLSFNLLKIAKSDSEIIDNAKVNWIACDIENLPLRENIFTTVVSIAVLHHIVGKKNRHKIMNEVYRSLKKQGITIISVWGYTNDQKKRAINKISNENLKAFRIGRVWFFKYNENNKKIKFQIKTFEKNTLVIPWKVDKGNGNISSTLRIYHFFKKDEFIKLKGDFEVICENTYGDEITGPNYFGAFRKN